MKKKTIDWNNAKEVEALFLVAYKEEDLGMLKKIIKQNKGTENYVKLVTGPLEMIKLVHLIKPETLTNDFRVELLVAAARADHSTQRIELLDKEGIAVGQKNADGKTACDIISDMIETTEYPKNKNGNLRKIQDENAKKNLIRYANPAPKKEPEDKNFVKRTALMIIIPLVLIALMLGGFELHSKWKESKSSKSTTEATTESTTEASDDSDSSESTEATTESQKLNTDKSLTVKDGDTVNIDFVGTVDGEEFDGGNTNGEGTDLTIGSGTYIDDFEDQLIGANVGDTVKVKVTFPDNYQSSDLAGKDAVFTTTINGIYE